MSHSLSKIIFMEIWFTCSKIYSACLANGEGMKTAGSTCQGSRASFRSSYNPGAWDPAPQTKATCERKIGSHHLQPGEPSWASNTVPPEAGAQVALCLLSQLPPTLYDPMDCSALTLLSMGLPRQENWSGWPFPSPGDLLDPGMEAMPPESPAPFSTSEPPGNPNLLFDKYIQPCNHNSKSQRTIWSILMSICRPIPHPLLAPGNLWPSFCHRSFAFSRISCKWNPTASTLRYLGSFTLCVCVWFF